MVRKYFLQQLGLLLMVSVIMVLTNILGYKMPVGDSIAGILVLCAIALFGLTVSKFMSQFIKLPSMMYVSLTGLLLACPISPVKDFVIGVTSQVAFMAPATALGAFAGISLGKDLNPSFSFTCLICASLKFSGAFSSGTSINSIFA